MNPVLARGLYLNDPERFGELVRYYPTLLTGVYDVPEICRPYLNPESRLVEYPRGILEILPVWEVGIEDYLELLMKEDYVPADRYAHRVMLNPSEAGHDANFRYILKGENDANYNHSAGACPVENIGQED